MRIDDHVLAGFIAGELSEEERASVTQELVRDSMLREWLQLATEALAAAENESSLGPKMRLIETYAPAMPNRLSGDRHSIPSSSKVRRAI
ncbi:MAG: hypothetical protein BMS9Abin05_1629 [Rhodothermia bacterium]|nr:MAG: hypothetical protein BMS9Abin05_1629 [Rhodothermia bacterium]